MVARFRSVHQSDERRRRWEALNVTTKFVPQIKNDCGCGTHFLKRSRGGNCLESRLSSLIEGQEKEDECGTEALFGGVASLVA